MSSAARTLSRTPGSARSARYTRTKAVKPLVKRGLLDRRRSIAAWGVSGGLLCAFTAAVYPSVQDSIGQAVESYPEGLKEAFGIGQLSTVEEYLSAEVFSLFVPLAMAFFAIRSIVRALPAAEESGQLDTLLSAPVSRAALALAGFATTAVALMAVLAIVGTFTWVGGWLAGADLAPGPVVAGVANVWPLALLFAGITLVITGLRPGSGLATGVAAGTLVAMYIFDLLGRLADAVEPLRTVSVFKYHGKAIEDGIDPLAFVGITLASVLLATIGARLFDRRDILG